MARRRNDGVLYLLAEMPWWVSVLVAGIVYMGVGRLLPALADGRIYLAPAAMALRPYAGFFGGLLLVPALLSVARTISRRLLLDRQSGLDSIRAMSWREFEMLCGEAFRRRGYAVQENGLGGADGGIDLILRKNGQTCLVQCKRWKTFKVGVKEVRELYGILAAEKADRGIFITAGSYTAEALQFAEGKALDLMNGEMLLALVKDVQMQKRVAASPPPSSPASDPMPSLPSCPRCGSSMIQRTARHGNKAGSRFWGCAAYPKCRGILEIA